VWYGGWFAKSQVGHAVYQAGETAQDGTTAIKMWLLGFYLFSANCLPF